MKWVSLGSEQEMDEESVKETREKLCYKLSRVRRKFGAPVSAVKKVVVAGDTVPLLNIPLKQEETEVPVCLWRDAALSDFTIGTQVQMSHLRGLVSGYGFRLQSTTYSQIEVLTSTPVRVVGVVDVEGTTGVLQLLSEDNSTLQIREDKWGPIEAAMKSPPIRFYEASFCKDYKHGDALYCWPTGHKFTGKFYLNRKEGYGRHLFPDGATFQGLYHADKRFGPGVAGYPDGRKDVGLWLGGHLLRLCTSVEEGFSLKNLPEYAAYMDPVEENNLFNLPVRNNRDEKPLKI